jgi:hypothetical protein
MMLDILQFYYFSIFNDLSDSLLKKGKAVAMSALSAAVILISSMVICNLFMFSI